MLKHFRGLVDETAAKSRFLSAFHRKGALHFLSICVCLSPQICAVFCRYASHMWDTLLMQCRRRLSFGCCCPIGRVLHCRQRCCLPAPCSLWGQEASTGERRQHRGACHCCICISRCAWQRNNRAADVCGCQPSERCTPAGKAGCALRFSSSRLYGLHPACCRYAWDHFQAHGVINYNTQQ